MCVLTVRRLALARLHAAAAARADDGGLAPAARWNHARGPASNSGMSRAAPPESFGGFAWTYRAKEAILFPPVVWDGIAFVVDGKELVALDLATGRPWARAAATAPGQPTAFAGSAFLVEEGQSLVQFRLARGQLARGWSHDAGEGLSAPRILDGEIYATTPAALLSLRVGLGAPAWKVEGVFTGEPAVRDGHVYALRRDGENLVLAAFARNDGAEKAAVVLGKGIEGAGGRIVIGREILAVLVDGHDWALVSRKLEGDRLDLSLVRTERLLGEPVAGNQALLAFTEEPRQWCFLLLNPKDPRRPLVTETERPDLFESPVSCTWLGESTQCYGDWCGDPWGNNILWHASERPEGAILRKGIRFHAVPARDALVLFVPEGGKSVVALAAEKIR